MVGNAMAIPKRWMDDQIPNYLPQSLKETISISFSFSYEPILVSIPLYNLLTNFYERTAC